MGSGDSMWWCTLVIAVFGKLKQEDDSSSPAYALAHVCTLVLSLTLK